MQGATQKTKKKERKVIFPNENDSTLVLIANWWTF